MTTPPEYEGFLYAASKDVLAVEALAQANIDVHCEAIVFHCQQAAEKMIKNVFVVNDVYPQKSHDIGDMMAKAISNGWLVADDPIMRSAIDLSLFAVVSRYETTPDISRGEALKAIADCNAIAEMLRENGYSAIEITLS